ncbi:4'-phosphopantetheinyl transferase superfamily protein [Microbacterium sp. AG157]|uniref:4'-phosphopantetheinyl transferase family protein n=1 Tax=Microbacterium sp. AG157 TaxID=2183993 RepID=UPI000E377A7A|nr:4'-phosphopantetheinyl transferase superfamily protein [Microbacterium sp. AG157]REC99680.1 4'-phosphopantetheinyl transferase superfamily protein [Microbacterium sp. AG157]
MIVAQWIDRSEYGAGGRPLRRAAGRALLSDTARLLGLGGLRVRRRPGQRPEAETPGVWFSMSHTGDLTVCAVATSNVAIDIEQQNARRERRMVSGPPVRFFTAAERELIARDPSRLLPVFTAKEAWAKYLGLGLALGFGSFDEASVIARDPGVEFTRVFIDGTVGTAVHRAGEGLVIRRRSLRPEQLAAGADIDRAERAR